MREEVNTIDSSDFFLDVFVSDDFTNYGGLLSLDPDDATSYPQAGVTYLQIGITISNQIIKNLGV